MRSFSEQIENALNLIYDLEKKASVKNNLLDRGKIIYLQVILFKIPFGPPRKRKFLKLCHSLYGADPEICLFVPNRKTGVKYKKTTDEFIDFCIDYYKELLEKHRVKEITTIIPLKQLRSEYGTYELKRKLTRRFDLFLCKNSLLYNERFLTSLGKTFRVANKEPLGVSFPKENVDFDPDFQKNIKKAIFTSSFYISRFSDNYSIPFGCLSNSKEELKENLESVLNQIFTEKIIPGGFKNIRAMNLWPSQSKPVPLYMSTELPVEMKKPVVKTKRKRRRGVEGELSSQPGKKVFVTPNGEVFVTKTGKNVSEPEVSDSEGEDSFVDESDEDVDYSEKEKKKENFKTEAIGIKEETESENDEEIEEKEVKLLNVKREAELNFYTEPKRKRKIKTEEEEEVEEEEDQDVNVKKKQKIKFSEMAADKTCNEKANIARKRKFNNKEKVNKAKKKMLIKQVKFNFNEKRYQKDKIKEKKP